MSVTPRLEPTQAKAPNFAAAPLALGEIRPSLKASVPESTPSLKASVPESLRP